MVFKYKSYTGGVILGTSLTLVEHGVLLPRHAPSVKNTKEQL